MDLSPIIWGALGMAAGGFLKGATGGGAPVLAVPIILFFDVPYAVAIFSIPNLLSNIVQGWQYRNELPSHRLWLPTSLGAVVGAAIGTVLLARLTPDALIAGVACIVYVYIAFRIARPTWTMARATGERFALLAGTGAGLLQGAGGISAPISLTYLNAMRLPRGEFIATISRMFLAMALVQIPMLYWYGIMDLKMMGISTLAAIPLFGAMPLGAWLVRRWSSRVFDRIILALLAVIATRMLFQALI